MKKQPLVIYHGNCQDGFTAAWASNLVHPEWEFYPGVHGTSPPFELIKNRDVYMLDFSYKRNVIEQILDILGTNEDGSDHILTIIDHHASAQKDLTPFTDGSYSDQYAGKLNIIFDMNKSGARLSWEYFHPDTSIPALVAFIEDRDLWRFNIEATKLVSNAIFSYEYDFKIWDELRRRCDNDLSGLILEGKAIMRKHDKDIKELLTVTKHKMIIAGVEVYAANLPYTMASDACHILCEESKLPFAATYYDTPTGRIFSLRSLDNGADVSEIASRYNGGGHVHAAGFKLEIGQKL